MKVAILSDTHDNMPNIEKACQWLKEQAVFKMIHCGDIASRETIVLMSKMFRGDIFIVFGNMDRDYVTQEEIESLGLKNVQVFGDVGELELDGCRFNFSHFPKKAKQLAASQKYDVVCYGHTHKPWIDKVGKTLLLCPGNLANQMYKPTFAVYDIDKKKPELKILERI